MIAIPELVAHFDLDAFFVSVECLRDPSLRGKALLVGGDSDRSVVAACSYEARKFGIHSAMPMKTARRLCPEATIVGGSRGEYSRYSRWVTEIIAERAPRFEKASIDEFYVDLTGMDKYVDPFAWTIELRETIQRNTQLPISFGLASSKILAKIATNEAKPNGYLQVPRGREKEFLAPLPVSKIPGVGKQSESLLRDAGIESIRDLQVLPVAQVEASLGKFGAELWQKAQGIHLSPVIPYQEAKSISSENTFEQDVADNGFLLAELVRMTERVGFSLRRQNKMTGCVAVKIRYPNFETTSRQTSIPYTYYDDELIAQAKGLFVQLHRPGRAIRLLGVRLSELTDQALQTSLFEDIGRKSGLYEAIDELKTRFGGDSIKKARGL
jgi:DNA polymerase-4